MGPEWWFREMEAVEEDHESGVPLSDAQIDEAVSERLRDQADLLNDERRED